MDIKVTNPSQEDYPAKLKNTLKTEHPKIIYYTGNVNLLEKNSIAVVGSRDVDDKGVAFTKQLAECAVNLDYVIVSGAARGVDSEAQQRALQCHGKVIVFLGTGISSYIKIKKHKDQITAGNLLVMSAVPCNMGYHVWNLLGRNKYLYGLSQGGFVVASDYGKGGTWSGAMENLTNNWVKTYVWDNALKGNAKLIEHGAIPVRLDNLEQTLKAIDKIKAPQKPLIMYDYSAIDPDSTLGILIGLQK
ncbi:MAG: hypothetical protein BEN18_06030 [Epulopiscium sp. Nuni2H_MBin001]|nr:MAG: hypothetical protein BEN18_06030 [Epulopiscium sp. Nuni2H_MBin001]